ncbi:MAG: hypothetical protein R3B90_05305 [Planctomycetaceae bacterium]
MRPPRSTASLPFKLVTVAGGLFAFTAMCMLATTFGHPDAPPNRFFNRYGVTIILIETVLLMVVAVFAMAHDRRTTLAARRQGESPDNGLTDAAAPLQHRAETTDSTGADERPH